MLLKERIHLREVLPLPAALQDNNHEGLHHGVFEWHWRTTYSFKLINVLKCLARGHLAEHMAVIGVKSAVALKIKESNWCADCKVFTPRLWGLKVWRRVSLFREAVGWADVIKLHLSCCELLLNFLRCLMMWCSEIGRLPTAICLHIEPQMSK